MTFDAELATGSSASINHALQIGAVAGAWQIDSRGKCKTQSSHAGPDRSSLAAPEYPHGQTRLPHTSRHKYFYRRDPACEL